MALKKSILIIIPVVLLAACSPKTWQITTESSTRIPIDNKTEALADTSYKRYLQPYKQRIDAEMNVVIGQAAETMRGHAPESLLSNFSADVYRSSAAAYLKSDVDIAVVNLGGLRTEVPAGDITVRKVFELMPFENELVVLWLRGDKLMELLQYFAKAGGEGVSGIRMEIRNGKAENITINGEAPDSKRLYSISTNDYLAGGNDKMIQLAMSEKRLNTGIKVRDMLLNYIKSETKKGNKIQSKLDGRIK